MKALLLIIGLIAGASPAAAQAAPARPVASVLYSSVTRGPLLFWSAEPRDSVVRDIRPTYWKEGALVAGLLGAVGGAVLGVVVCESGKGCIIAGSLGGALLLAIPGALIGGQFRKRPTSHE